MHFAEDRDHLCDVLGWGALKAELAIYARRAAELAPACVGPGPLSRRDCAGGLAILYLPAHAMFAACVSAFPLARAVVPESPIGRRSDDALYRFVQQRPQLLHRITFQDFVVHH